MEKSNEKRSDEERIKQGQPGDLSSFNNRDKERSSQTEKADEGKDESESFMDYNGNSEQNAPARSE